MLMTPMVPKVMARPIAASSSTEPSEMPYQTFCAIDQAASVLRTVSAPASAAVLTSPSVAAAAICSTAMRVAIAAIAHEGDRVELLRRRACRVS